MRVNIVFFLDSSRKLTGNYYFHELFFIFSVNPPPPLSGCVFQFSFHYLSVVISLAHTSNEQHAKQLQAEAARSKLIPHLSTGLSRRLSLLKQLHIPPSLSFFLFLLSSFCYSFFSFDFSLFEQRHILRSL